MTDWKIIHTRFPVICEGEPGRSQGRYKGCAAWNPFNGMCGRFFRASDDPGKGMCSLSVDSAIEMEKAILSGRK